MPKAIEQFDFTIKRSIKLIELYKRLHGKRLNSSRGLPALTCSHDELSDLLRSALVLSVSAMDAYFTNKFADLLVPFLKKHGPSDKLVELLSKAGLDTEQALILIQMERPNRRLRSIVESYFERYVTRKREVIDSLFLAYKIKNFCERTQGVAGRTTLVRNVEKAVERRHMIVHEGDLNDHGKVKKIDAGKVENQIKNIDKFVKGAEILIKRSLKLS